MAKSIWKEAILAELREARARVEALESALKRGLAKDAEKEHSKNKKEEK